jgi:2-C-methyl-D-erythritol 2,4-cyclodiphosphate synthase
VAEPDSQIRVGLGFDLHRRDEQRPLWLGGVRFEDAPGLAGHSDGDVICHAVAEALLGAAGLGDLGQHFPDTDPAFKGIGGLDLLARAVELAGRQGCVPSGCDLTLIAARPQLAPRRDQIQANLGRVLDLPPEKVSVKATRPEGLGLTGDGAGCIALVTMTTRG